MYFKLSFFLIFMTLFANMNLVNAQEKQIYIDSHTAAKRIDDSLKIDRVKVDGNWVTQKKLKSFIDELINVNDTNNSVFVRWSKPIRYYYEGLDEFPNIQKEFESLIEEVAIITQKKIIKHNQIFWPIKGGSDYHPDAPGKKYTNVVFIFTRDMEKVFQSSDFKKFHKLAKIDTDKTLSNWKAKNDDSGDDRMVTDISNKNGLIYYHSINDVREILGDGNKNLGKQKSYFRAVIFWMMLANPGLSRSNSLTPSLVNFDGKKTDLQIFNQLDTELLKAYYGKVYIGVNKNFAAKQLFQNLWLSLTSFDKQ